MTATENAAPAVDKSEQANRVIRNCSLLSIGAGILPFPVVDLVALGGVQVYAISELCGIYGIPFSRQRVKSILSAIAGGVAPAFAFPLAASLVKLVPVVGQAAGVATMPALTGTSTLVVGKIFKRHFEAGGGLHDVDVEAMKAEYAEEMEKAKEENAKSHGKKAAASAAA